MAKTKQTVTEECSECSTSVSVNLDTVPSSGEVTCPTCGESIKLCTLCLLAGGFKCDASDNTECSRRISVGKTAWM